MKITLLGAGGKMGGRITANLHHLPQYEVGYVEASEERRKQMAEAGIKTTGMEEALGRTEAVILGVPDRLIGKITHQIVRKLKPGTIVIGLDPARAYAGVTLAKTIELELNWARESVEYLATIGFLTK